MIELALYKGTSRIENRVIRWWTRSPYSHCELVINGFSMTSSRMDGGVRGKRIDFKPANWDLLPLHWADQDLVLSHFDRTEGQPYALLREMFMAQVMNRPDHEGLPFCSLWCAQALGLPTPAIWRPDTLGEICAHLNTLCP